MKKILTGTQEEQNLLETWKKYMEAVRATMEKREELSHAVAFHTDKALSLEECTRIMESYEEEVCIAEEAFYKARELYATLPREIRVERNKMAHNAYLRARNEWNIELTELRTTANTVKQPWERAKSVISFERAYTTFVEAKIKYELLNEIGEA